MGVPDDGDRVTAADAATWLDGNHESATGVWLLSVRGNATSGVGYEDAIQQALCFGWIDGPVSTFDDGKVGQWFSPRRPASGRASTNKASIAELEATGMLARAGVRVLKAARTSGSWTLLDGTEAGIEPEELTFALNSVPAARAGWDAFPPSARKLGLTHIAMARRPETPSARIAKIVSNAAERKQQ